MHILLATDQPASGVIVRDVLVAGGHTVTQVANTDITLGGIEAAHPDLVLLDMFAARMTDWAILNALLFLPGAPPVVALTGNLISPEALATLAFQARGHMVKPFAPADLLHMCERAAARSAVTPEDGYDQPRAEPRVLFSGDATLLTDAGHPLLALRVIDLSEHGAKLEIGRGLASSLVAGSRIKMRLLRPPDFQWADVEAVVQWRRDDAMGVRLL